MAVHLSLPLPRRDKARSFSQADELTQLKRQFLANLNHEIRTPLSGILGMTDLLRETRLNEEQKEYVNAASECAVNLLALFNAALEFSDLCAGKVALEEIDFDLPDTLKAAAFGYLAKAGAKGLRLTCTLDGSLPAAAMGDAFRLRQVLGHLLDNAIKFTQKGDIEVTANAARSGGERFWLTVEIRDTGVGIAPHRVQEIFEPFHQLDSGMSRSYSGLGLGLALVQKLLELMSGEISVQSEPNKGSSFSFTVPLRVSYADVADQAQSSLASVSPRILIVEDSAIAQQVATHILRRRYEVRCVDSGEQAVRAVNEDRYDLILMDLQMPGMDGLETTAEIRRLPGCAKIPILALTANTTDEYRRLCHQQGMQGFITKPVQSEELLKTVSQFLG
jgi:CheY-like chemotaxis protein